MRSKIVMNEELKKALLEGSDVNTFANLLFKDNIDKNKFLKDSCSLEDGGMISIDFTPIYEDSSDISITQILEEVLSSENEELDLYEKIISKENLTVLEVNIDFFQDIPKSKIRDILIKFIEIIPEYEKIEESDRIFKSIFNTKINHKLKPSKKIEQAIKVIDEYQAIIKDLFFLIDDKGNFKDENTRQASDIYQFNNRLLDDLNNKEFEVVDRNIFYQQTSTKIEIKQFLKDLRETYKLDKVSLSEKQLIDTLSLPNR
ncbi:MAG: hypothetical protein DRG78_10290 [Epsilonproteobacteria bacterium]|nr:MAG: hypothetical protein DRG78_10290 [Campylobacterota bacterium]